jgi:hypothetical protein
LPLRASTVPIQFRRLISLRNLIVSRARALLNLDMDVLRVCCYLNVVWLSVLQADIWQE